MHSKFVFSLDCEREQQQETQERHTSKFDHVIAITMISPQEYLVKGKTKIVDAIARETALHSSVNRERQRKKKHDHLIKYTLGKSEWDSIV